MPREQEFQRIDIKEDEEQQCAIERNRPRVLKPIAPEKAVMQVPDVASRLKQIPKTMKPCMSSSSSGNVLGTRGRPPAGSPQGENGIGKPFEARDFVAAPAKPGFADRMGADEVSADHAPGI